MAIDFSGWNTLGQGLNQAIGSFADLSGLSGKAQALADLRATLNGQPAPKTPFQTLGGMLKNGWNDITGQGGSPTDGRALAGQTLAGLSTPPTMPAQANSIPKAGYGSNGLPDATNEGLLRQSINPYANNPQAPAAGQLPGGGTFGQKYAAATAAPGLTNMALDPARARTAIDQIESGGNTQAVGPVTAYKDGRQDRPYGAEQVMGSNIPAWTQQYYGRSLSPQEFLANPEAQAAVFKGEFGRLAAKYGPEGAAQAWLGGEGSVGKVNRADVNGTTVGGYAQRFAQLYGSNGAPAPAGGQVDATGAIPAAPAAGPQAGVGANIPTEALVRLYTNPNLPQEDKALVANLLQMRMPQPKQFGFQLGADGTLYRTNATTGEAGVAAQGGPKPTTDQQDYQTAVKQGFQGSLYDYQRGLKTAGAQVIQVGSGEKSYDQKQGENLAGDMAGVQKEGTVAQSQLNTFGAMQKAAADPNFYAGIGGRYKATLDKAWTLIGGDPKTPASNETFNALASKSVLESLGGSLGTGVSNADRDFIQNTVPNLDMSPQGIKNLIDIQTKIAQRKIDVAKMARQYATSHGGRLDYGFQDVVNDYATKNPLFGQSGAPAAPAPGTIDGGYRFKGGDPGDAKNWEPMQ